AARGDPGARGRRDQGRARAGSVQAHPRQGRGARRQHAGGIREDAARRSGEVRGSGEALGREGRLVFTSLFSRYALLTIQKPRAKAGGRIRQNIRSERSLLRSVLSSTTGWFLCLRMARSAAPLRIAR